ncbi:ABC transporter permease [Longispora albida]|uniref:ABC transporter permease n=1 Tax=Longispora albida TaxID=203523 RepID=UPI0003775487|nr:ABC transporter permease [Longispora albida]
MSLGWYAARRLGLGVAQVLAVVTVIFALTWALPGDAAVVIAGDDPDPARIAGIRAALGLDQPVMDRYTSWLGGLATGDLGRSLVTGQPVTAVLGAASEPTLLLAGVTLLFLVPAAGALGITCATRAGGRFDRWTTTVTVALHAIPEYALAVLLIGFFALYLGLLPATALGELTPAALVLPVTVLVSRSLCSLARLIRASLIEALASDYVAHARRHGVPAARVLFRHALPNALAPAVQQLARTADWLLGGIIVVEAVFAVPGLSAAVVSSVASRDVPVLQGLAVLFAVLTVVLHLGADVLAYRLAPRAVS